MNVQITNNCPGQNRHAVRTAGQAQRWPHLQRTAGQSNNWLKSFASLTRDRRSRPLSQTLATMPIKISSPANILVLFTLALAALGGIFFGLYSCGGYYWHIQAYWISALLFVVGSVMLKNQVLNTLGSKLLFPIIYLVLFLASQSVAATFYPSAPESFSEFMRNFLITVEYGPCA